MKLTHNTDKIMNFTDKIIAKLRFLLREKKQTKPLNILLILLSKKQQKVKTMNYTIKDKKRTALKGVSRKNIKNEYVRLVNRSYE